MPIEQFAPELEKIISLSEPIQMLADDFGGPQGPAEGPVWWKDGGYLLLSDVPQNVVYRWKQGEGAREYLRPSGYTGSTPRGGEMGSNGLTLDRRGRLVDGHLHRAGEVRRRLRRVARSPAG